MYRGKGVPTLNADNEFAFLNATCKKVSMDEEVQSDSAATESDWLGQHIVAMFKTLALHHHSS